MRLSLVLCFFVGGCIFADIEKNAPRDMSGCVPSPSCGMVDGAIAQDMHTPSDGGVCEMICPGGDMAPDLAGYCADSSGCGESSPVCSSSHQCSACTAGSSTECATYHSPKALCGPAGACVECLSRDDCAATNRACNLTTHACGPCAIHSDCTTGVCKSGGVCASPSEVAYVNRNLPACSDASHASSPTLPYCQVSGALMMMPSPKPYIVVAGSATPYNPVSLNTTTGAIGPLVIIGPGASASPAPATLAGSGVVTPDGLFVQTAAGHTATVTVDGMVLTGAGGATPGAGARCAVGTGAATLTVVNSYIHGSGAAGVDSSGCTLALDANAISTNAGGGIKLADTSYTVTNNLITDNGLAGPGVLLSGNVSGLFWFNTITGNKRSGTNAGAFNCGGVTSATPPLIQASIIYGNDKNGGGSSTGAGCNFSYSDVDDGTTGTGNFSMAPNFIDSGNGNWRIQLPSPCADKITAATGLTGGTLPAHDVDNHPRPRTGGGYDVGGSQAQ